MSSPPIVHDSHGRALPLGRPLGVGGEGTVYEVLGDSKLVAKIYHEPVGAERADKLRALCQIGTDALLGIAAWPIDLLIGAQDRLAGLSMPRVPGKPIHLLYGPRSRRTEFPRADWAFLLHAAINLARAFAVVHEHGHLVGDVNPENARVTEQAMTRLIDCDSFQIEWKGRTFLCGVGVSTHVPPELQQGSLRVRRTANHDLFGLAVLIFQTLFFGRHPFSGRHAGLEEISLEQAVRELRFAYRRSTAARTQPPNTPGLWAVSEEVAVLFEQAFSAEGTRAEGRPTARQWVRALETLRLERCGLNPSHTYCADLPGCPWCEIEKRSGAVLFRRTGASSISDFDLEGVWSQIAAIRPPASPPSLPSPAAFPATPSPTALRKRKRLKTWKVLFIVLMLAAQCVLIWISGQRTPDPEPTFLGSFLATTFLCALGIKQLERRARRPLEPLAQQAREHFAALTVRWQAEADDSSFEDRLLEARHLRQRYLEIWDWKQQGIARLVDPSTTFQEAPAEDPEAEMRRIERELLTALDGLRRMARQIVERRNTLQAEIEAVARAVAQAEADLRTI